MAPTIWVISSITVGSTSLFTQPTLCANNRYLRLFFELRSSQDYAMSLVDTFPIFSRIASHIFKLLQKTEMNELGPLKEEKM